MLHCPKIKQGNIMAQSKAYQQITEKEWKLEDFADDNMLGAALSLEIPANKYNLKQRIIVSHVIDLVQAKLRGIEAPELAGKPGSYSFLFDKEMVSTIETALNKQYRVRLSKTAETDQNIHYHLNEDKFSARRANQVVDAIANIVVENALITTKASTPIWLALTCGLIGSSKPIVTITSNDFEKLASALTTKLAQNLDYSRETSRADEYTRQKTSSGEGSNHSTKERQITLKELDIHTTPPLGSRKHPSKEHLKSPKITKDKRLTNINSELAVSNFAM